MTSIEELKKKCGERLNFKPFQTLLNVANSSELDITGTAFARLLDERDELKNLREEFHYPKMKDLPPGKLKINRFRLKLKKLNVVYVRDRNLRGLSSQTSLFPDLRR